ncbi:hypothetical protein [Tsuneonella troitsensis]|uniref:hypothetical protein n=1 Tax=Tsuneonella troitsensis TaxID=292222 RepID=UPI00070CB603|nr:hypothetical protein [Tsuneonella troitsensis]
MVYEPIRIWVSEQSLNRDMLTQIRTLVREELLSKQWLRPATRRPKQRDLTCAVRGLISAGLDITRVEISADGSILVDTTPIHGIKDSVETEFFKSRARARR